MIFKLQVPLAKKKNRKIENPKHTLPNCWEYRKAHKRPRALGIKFHFSFPIDPDSLDALLSNFRCPPIPILLKCPQFFGLLAPYAPPNRISDLAFDLSIGRSNCNVFQMAIYGGYFYWPPPVAFRINWILIRHTHTHTCRFGFSWRMMTFWFRPESAQSAFQVVFGRFSLDLLFSFRTFFFSDAALFCMLICLSDLSRGKSVYSFKENLFLQSRQCGKKYLNWWPNVYSYL